MATIQDLAREYAQRLASSTNPAITAREIINEINLLRFDTGGLIHHEAKLQIAKEIKSYNFLFEQKGNTQYLAMVDFIYSQLNKK